MHGQKERSTGHSEYGIPVIRSYAALVTQIGSQYTFVRQPTGSGTDIEFRHKLFAQTVEADIRIGRGRHFRFRTDGESVTGTEDDKAELFARLVIAESLLHAARGYLHPSDREKLRDLEAKQAYLKLIQQVFVREYNNPRVRTLQDLIRSHREYRESRPKSISRLYGPIALAVTAGLFKAAEPFIDASVNARGFAYGSAQTVSMESVPATVTIGRFMSSPVEVTPITEAPIDPEILEMRFDSNPTDRYLPEIGWARLRTDFSDKLLQYYSEFVRNGLIPDKLASMQGVSPKVEFHSGGELYALFQQQGWAHAVSFQSQPAIDIPMFFQTEYRGRRYLVSPVIFKNIDGSRGVLMNLMPLTWRDRAPDIKQLLGTVQDFPPLPIIADTADNYRKTAPAGSVSSMDANLAEYLAGTVVGELSSAYDEWERTGILPEYFRTHPVVAFEIGRVRRPVKIRQAYRTDSFHQRDIDAPVYRNGMMYR